MEKTFKFKNLLIKIKWSKYLWFVTSYYGSRRISYIQFYKETSIDNYNVYGFIIFGLSIAWAFLGHKK